MISFKRAGLIIYSYFTGKLRDFYPTKGFQDQRGMFCLKNWTREPVVNKNVWIPEKVVVHNFIVFWDENERIYYINFTERVVILFNCYQGTLSNFMNRIVQIWVLK